MGIFDNDASGSGVYDGLDMNDRLGLAFSNLASFDQGGIDMHKAASQLQTIKTAREDRTIAGQREERAHDYLSRTAPELIPQLEAGGDAWQLMNQAWGLQRDRATQAKEDERHVFNTQMLPEGRGRDAFESGAITDFQEAYEFGQSGSDLDQFGLPTSGTISQKVQAYTQMGIDPQRALGLATGRLILRTNPLTGEASIVDMAEGAMTPVGGQEPILPTPPQPAPQGAGLYDAAPAATGIGASLAGASSNTLGQLPGELGDAFTFPANVEAGQEFDLFKRELIQSLSLNPRFPIAEQQRIEGLMPVGPHIAPDTLKSALVTLGAELTRIQQDMERSIQNPGTSVEQRQQDIQTLRGVQIAIQRLGLPQQDTQAPPSNGTLTTPNNLQYRILN